MLLLAPEVTRFLDFDCLLPWMDIVRSSSDKFLNTSFRTTIAKLEKQGKKSRRKLAWAVSGSIQSITRRPATGRGPGYPIESGIHKTGNCGNDE